ncbi:hypothetical protein BDV19DRAFT_388221 [Aspergillus venezuelensis]
MTPTRSWTALVLLSPLVASLPLPLQPTESASECYTNKNTNRNTTPNIHPSLKARAPDPRMIPNKTDLLSNLFAKLGMEKHDELNKLHHDEHPEDNAIIDDSQGTTVTVTSHDNYFNVVASPVSSPSASPSASAAASHSPSAPLASTSTSSPVASTSAGSGSSAAEVEGSASDIDADANAESEPESDPTEDTQGFVDSLFDELRKKFREVINGSDEVTLR